MNTTRGDFFRSIQTQEDGRTVGVSYSTVLKVSIVVSYRWEEKATLIAPISANSKPENCATRWMPT
jgi:hypothetical protein